MIEARGGRGGGRGGEDFHPDPAQDIAHHPDLAQNIVHPPDPLPDLNFLEIEFLLKANYELPF